jgi:RsiW-degrading membrane proteinase PrsW (M82 family)
MAELQCDTNLYSYFSRNFGMQSEKGLNTPHKEKSRIKVWISQLDPALKSRRTWKTFIRCWAVLTTTLVLMVSPTISSVVGQASFFCALVYSDLVIILISELDRHRQGCGPYDAAIDGRLCFHCSSIYNDHRYTSSNANHLCRSFFSGMLLGWAWGNAAMAVALHVRSPIQLARQTKFFSLSSVIFP